MTNSSEQTFSGGGPVPDRHIRPESVVGLFNVHEAIASCSLEHREGCGCTICRANAGDQEAYAEVMAGVMLGGADVLRPR